MLGTCTTDKMFFFKVSSHRRAYLSTPFVAFKGWLVFVGVVLKVEFPFCGVLLISLSHVDKVFWCSFRCLREATIRSALFVERGWEGRSGEALTDG